MFLKFPVYFWHMRIMEETNCQIIRKATELFLSRGFKSVTMDDIANEMGMSKKTIYQNFSTKTDLVSASADAIFNHIKCGIDAIRTKKLNPIEELYTINDYVLKNLNNEAAAPEYQLIKYYPKIHARLNKMKYDTIEDCIYVNLNRGIELGLYRPQIDISMISRFYFIGVSGLRNIDVFPNTQFQPKLLTNYYLDYHVRGISTAKGITYLEKLENKRNQNIKS